MNRSKEIGWGMIWGALTALLITLFIFSVGRSEEPADNGDLEISISADSVKVVMEKNGIEKTVTIGKDQLNKTSSGITVENELTIENGRIFIDGIELTEDELERLSVDKEEREKGWDVNIGKRNDRVTKRTRLVTVYTDTDNDVVKFGDIVIEKGVKVSGDAVSMGGDITIYGEVMGDAVSVFGDVHVEAGGYVAGDAVSPFGKIYQDEDAEVGGDAVSVRRFGAKDHWVTFGLEGGYNRVEGLSLIPRLKYEDEKGRHPTLNLNGGYAFALKRWEYDFGVEHKIGQNWGPRFFGGMFRQVRSSDYWLIPRLPENTIAALIFKEDFYDYYWARGFSGGGGVWYGDHLNATLAYTGAAIETLRKNTDKALFGGKKKFRENWSTVLPDSLSIAAMEGDLKTIDLGLEYDSRDDKFEPESGIRAFLGMEKTLDSDSSDFEYQTVSTEVKFYYPAATDQTVFVRLRGGYSDDVLPLFKRYFIGGLGSLRGYDYKEFEGNRYILVNTEYIWRFFDSDLGAGVFFDAGKAAFGGKEFETADLKTAVGISFLFGDDLRLNLAQRLDDIDRSPVFSLRGQILF